MIDQNDPLERLRAANPVPAQVSTLPSPDPVLFHRIASGMAEQQYARARRRRRARRLVPVLVVSSLLGATTAYALRRTVPAKPQSVACYEAPDLESRTEVVPVDRDGPVDACAELWRRGVLGVGGERPPLVECVLESGVAGVFPARPGVDACRHLADAPRPSDPATAGATDPRPVPVPPPDGRVNERFLAFRDVVLPQFLDRGCIDARAGVAIVRRELDAAGLGDWVVVPGDGFSPERPCATLLFRPEAREVVLVPAPGRR